MSLLYQVSNVIHSTLDSQEALQLIVSEAVRVTYASSGSLVLINPNTSFLEIHAAQNLSSTARKLKLRVGEGITGWVARHGRPVRCGGMSGLNWLCRSKFRVRSAGLSTWIPIASRLFPPTTRNCCKSSLYRRPR